MRSGVRNFSLTSSPSADDGVYRPRRRVPKELCWLAAGDQDGNIQMALINVKKKIEKASSKLGLEQGEVVEAACTTNPTGTMKKMLAKELGGLIGSALASSGDGSVPADGGLAEQFPSGQYFLVLTNSRLFVASLSAMTGKPKEILAQWERSQIETIVVGDGKLSLPLIIVFSDGTAVEIEGAGPTNPGALAEAIAA